MVAFPLAIDIIILSENQNKGECSMKKSKDSMVSVLCQIKKSFPRENGYIRFHGKSFTAEFYSVENIEQISFIGTNGDFSGETNISVFTLDILYCLFPLLKNAENIDPIKTHSYEDSRPEVVIPDTFFPICRTSLPCGVDNFCTKDENQRYVLKGVLMDTKNRCFVSTDGLRMEKVSPDNFETEKEENIIIPQNIYSFLASLKAPVFFSGSENAIYADRVQAKVDLDEGELIVIWKKLDGMFPTYSQVIPSTSTSTYLKTFNLENLISALKKEILVAKATKALHTRYAIDFIGEDDSILTVQFTSKYLLDLCEIYKLRGNDRIYCRIKNENSAAIFSPSRHFSDSLHVIMPICC